MNYEKTYLESYLMQAKNIPANQNYDEALGKIKNRMIANHRREQGISEIEFQEYMDRFSAIANAKKQAYDEKLLIEINKNSTKNRKSKIALQKEQKEKKIKRESSLNFISRMKRKDKVVSLNGRKFAYISTGAIGMFVIVSLLACHNQSDESQTQESYTEIVSTASDATNNTPKVVMELGDNVENPQYEIDQNFGFIKDSLPKYVYFGDGSGSLLIKYIEYLESARMILNMEEYSDLGWAQRLAVEFANGKATFKKTDRELWENYDEFTQNIELSNWDSSFKDGTVLDASFLISDEYNRNFVQKSFDNIGKINDYIASNDIEGLNYYCKNMNQWVEENFFYDKKSTYNEGAMDLAIINVITAKQILKENNYNKAADLFLNSGSEETLISHRKDCSDFSHKDNDGRNNMQVQGYKSINEMLALKREAAEKYLDQIDFSIGNYDYIVEETATRVLFENLFSTYRERTTKVYNSSFYSKSVGTQTTNSNSVTSSTAASKQQQVTQKAIVEKVETGAVKNLPQSVQNQLNEKYKKQTEIVINPGTSREQTIYTGEDAENQMVSAELLTEAANYAKYDRNKYGAGSSPLSIWDHLDKNSYTSAQQEQLETAYNKTKSEIQETDQNASTKEKEHYQNVPDREVGDGKVIGDKDGTHFAGGEDTRKDPQENAQTPPSPSELNKDNQSQNNNSGSNQPSSSGDNQQNNTETAGDWEVVDSGTYGGGDSAKTENTSSQKAASSNTEAVQEAETKSAEDTAQEALKEAGHSDVEIKVETTQPLAFNTFRDSFIKQLKEFKQMLTPQKNLTNSMYCSNKTETNSYVKTLQKIEPVVQSKTI